MPPPFRAIRAAALGLAFATLLLGGARGDTTTPFDADWRFHLGDATGAESPAYDDSAWRRLDLPHDWSIESTPSADAPSAGGGGFFQTGVGWYRKAFTVPAEWRQHLVWLELDGVYRDATIWLNGALLGERPSGSASYRYDLSPHLRAAGPNVIAVHVDNSAQPNSRYYTGSGIHRHVRIRTSDPRHVVPDSLFVTTRTLRPDSATLGVAANLANCDPREEPFEVEATVLDSRGLAVASRRSALSIGPGGTFPFSTEMAVPQPRPWSPESPEMYRLRLRMLTAQGECDAVETSFGIRTLTVDAEHGLQLNGRSMKLFGGNVHDDNGPLGAAAFDRAEERRAELLKAAGFNAVRTAHNPPAPAFLAACDRVGLLVIDEAFDGWRKKKLAADYARDFDAWAQRDLAAMVIRDRNHPSVVTWSIGNEPYERAGATGAEIAKRLAAIVRALDPTRPVTAGINGPGKASDWRVLDPLFAALDVAGYNYELARVDADHVRLPGRVIVGTESYQTDAFTAWSTVNSRAYVLGDFVWTAMDYLGEAGIGRVFAPGEPVRAHWEGSHFPWHGAVCGDIDLIGQRRPLSHYRAIVWDRGERLYAAVEVPSPNGRPWQPTQWASPPLRASWTWPGNEQRELQLQVYSRHDAVRVTLNGAVIGEQPTTAAQRFKAVFPVVYHAGELRVTGLDAGKKTETFTLVTAGPAAALRLNADRSTLRADGQELAFVTVEVVDGSNTHAPAANDLVTFSVSGPADIAAIGNADLTDTASYRANPHRLFQGRGLVVLRTKRGGIGRITLTASAAGLKDASVTVEAKNGSDSR